MKNIYKKKRVEKENSIKRKEREEELEKQRRAEKNKQIEDKKKLGELKKDLQVTKKAEEDDRLAADQLIDEANRKLKEALKNNNLQEAKVAQGMLDGVRAMRLRSEVLHKKKTVSLEKKVEKRTSSLLDNLFRDNSKKLRTDDKGTR